MKRKKSEAKRIWTGTIAAAMAVLLLLVGNASAATSLSVFPTTRELPINSIGLYALTLSTSDSGSGTLTWNTANDKITARINSVGSFVQSGSYSFSNTPGTAQTFTLEVMLATDATIGETQQITINYMYGGNVKETTSTGVTPSPALPMFDASGTVFDDSNGNGVKDPGESGLSGWTVKLFINSGPDSGSLISTRTPGADGNYSFTDLYALASYTISIDPQAGWTQTSPTPIPPGNYQIPPGSTDMTGLDFGEAAIPPPTTTPTPTPSPTPTPVPMTVKIISPTSDDVYSTNPLSPITVEGSVSGGTAPYVFKWIIDGVVQTETAMKWDLYGQSLGAGVHTIKLQVTDSSGTVESEMKFNLYTKTIAIVPVDFIDEHQTGEPASNLNSKAEYLKNYYDTQSFGKEKIGYKVIVNSENNGWFKINENFDDIYNGIQNYPAIKDGLICGPLPESVTCSLPVQKSSDYGEAYWQAGLMHTWFAGMNESGLKVRMNINRDYKPEKNLKEFKPDKYDVGIVVYATSPKICQPYLDLQCPNGAAPYRNTGSIVIRGPKVVHYWVHELGHIYGLNDEGGMYSISNIGNWGAMGGGHAQNPPPPLILYDKEKNKWIHKSIVLNDPGKYIVRNINDKDGLVPNGMLKYGNVDDYYIFEGRKPYDNIDPEPGDVIPNPTPLKSDEGIEVYHVENANTANEKITAKNADVWYILFSWPDANRVTMVPNDVIRIYGDTVEVTALREKDGILRVKINELKPWLKSVITMKSSISSPKSKSILKFGSEGNFDTNLHAITVDGKRIGMDETTGEYYNEIEGGNSSGNYMGGGEEWISTPSNKYIRVYATLTQDLKDLLRNDTNASVEITSTLTTYNATGNSTTSTPVTITVNSTNVDSDLTLSAPLNLTFLPPIGSGKQYNVKQGSTMPINFQLKNSAGENVPNATAAIYWINGTGKEINGTAPGKSSIGNLVSYNSSSQIYSYNLKTTPIEPENRTIVVRLGDGTIRTTNIGVRK